MAVSVASRRQLFRCTTLGALAGIGLLAPALAAQLIRPDSATATSEFSGGYVISNAINGSGLPAGFGIGDAHATYVSGNHWTTQANRTLGESATFSFNTPRSLGGLYMWAHRSNNIATNANYAVTLFDLVLRDGPAGAGNVLATFTGLTGRAQVATAQTIPFAITPGVRSVQFIVRATANGNVSPYTGLAEVAFAPCIAPTATDPIDALICPGGDASYSVVATGSGPFTIQWQIETAPDAWQTLGNDPAPLPCGVSAFVTPINSPSASIGVRSGVDGGCQGPFRVRCLVSNACGSVTTAPARLALCSKDINCDGDVNPDDLGDFITCYFSSPPCSTADFNADGDVNPDDLGDCITTFFGPAC